MSQVKSSIEPLREQFDGVYRRGLLEPYRAKKARQAWRLDSIKYVKMQDNSWKKADKKEKKNKKFGIVGEK